MTEKKIGGEAQLVIKLGSLGQGTGGGTYRNPVKSHIFKLRGGAPRENTYGGRTGRQGKGMEGK